MSCRVEMEPVEEYKYKGYTIKYFNDEDAPNPRTEFDNMGIMVCANKRYTLGEEDFGNAPQYADNWDDAFALYIAQKYGPFYVDEYADEGKPEAWLSKARKYVRDNIVYLPVYMLDHSGITINTTGFSCPWDSGQIGFIYVDKDKIRDEYSIKRVTDEYIIKAQEVLRSEVKIFDAYLTGKVLYYHIEDPKGKFVDELHGFYIIDDDEYKYMESEAKAAVDADIEYRLKRREKKLKALIVARAPLEVRQQVLLNY